MKKFIYISNIKMTCGVTTEDDIVTNTPPILRKFIGQNISNLRNWMKQQEEYKEKEILGSSLTGKTSDSESEE